MTTIDSDPTLTFEAPGNRSWDRDRDHQDRPRSRALRAPFERAFAAGMAEVFARYGLPLASGEVTHVHGWAYLRMLPVGAPDKPGPSKPPPGPVLKVLSRVHPELRRRTKTARAAIEELRWCRDADGWLQDEKARWETEMVDRQAVELATLDDGALADHLLEASQRAEDMLRRHFELVGPALGIGRLLVAAGSWGLPPTDVITALRGASPASSATRPLLAGLAAELDAAGAEVATIDDLRAVSPRAAALVDEYLGRFGWRVLNDDLVSATVAEQPEVLLEAVQAERAASGGAKAPMADLDRLRGRVPESGRETFDQLVDEARHCYSVLDDNSGVTLWSVGLMRRAYVEAGARLAGRGALQDAAHVFELERDEAAALLRGGAAVDAAEAAARWRLVEAASSITPPETLGPPAAPPPDASLLPSAMGELTSWIGVYLSLRFDPGGSASTGAVLVGDERVGEGHGVGTGSVSGTACVVRDVDEAFDRLQPGQVLVCPFTNPAYNVLFPLVSGVVAEFGGPLGHTAVMAREFGFPAVVGTGRLAVTDGATVTLEVQELSGG